MRRKNVQNIRDVIQEIIGADTRLSSGLLEARVVQNWAQVLGPSVARATRRVYLYEGKLFVELNSSVVRNELMMLRDRIVKSLNQSVGSDVVKEIVLR
ncbi:uncharacterized protein DUF721 [Breznakibacter xylanolyticus]|uniref:Uncharacterized protein DUF721 n=1 Tax=Breznakibacter xylanolyticus TaxID=990 RepID=A0A2W7Q417_9BACT|nr:DUF721 domain-containing protein [Breznakibacter xylanolyticus]MBN2742831.1 DUF721 domain-containing protein [Marinilabiliaceae bacterium]PZX16409.1 uncharacterized protein DUF721 [Breznakibacter xylanolyticus]